MLKKIIQFELRMIKRVVIPLMIGGVGSLLYGLNCLRQAPPNSLKEGEGATTPGKSVSYFGGLIKLDNVQSEGTSEGNFKAAGAATGFSKLWSWRASTSTADSGEETEQSTSTSNSASWSGKAEI